jgi:hypothetical protein
VDGPYGPCMTFITCTYYVHRGAGSMTVRESTRVMEMTRVQEEP